MVPTWGVQQTVSATSQRECQVEVIWLVGLLGWCGWHLSLLMMLESLLSQRKPVVTEWSTAWTASLVGECLGRSFRHLRDAGLEKLSIR